VIVNLETKEVVKRMADGVDICSGRLVEVYLEKFIRVMEGDLVEFHLHNHHPVKCHIILIFTL
jgi:nitrite reductase (NO-forming)